MDKLESIKREDLARKNSLIVKSAFVSVILAAAVDIIMKKELAVILAILIAGGIGLCIVWLLHRIPSAIHIVPYTSMILITAVMFIIMENSVSPTAFFLAYFIIAAAAIYMDTVLLWLAFFLGNTLITAFAALHHGTLPLEMKNYVTIYLLYLLVTVLLSFQFSISRKLAENIVLSQEKTAQLLKTDQEIRRAIDKGTADISEMIEQVKERSGKNFEAAYSMSRSIAEVSAGMQTQSEAIMGINQSLSVANKQAEDTTLLSEKLHQDAASAELITRTGDALVGRLAEEMGVSYKEMQNAIAKMSSLSLRIQDTSAFTDSIQEIASQTNMLALNASIEAARAGERGKGFAVVADEVRKLADLTRKTAIMISENLQEVISETEAAKEDLGAAGKTITGNLTLTSDTQQAFEEIFTAFIRLKEDIASYSSMTRQIKESSHSIGNAVTEFSSVIEQASASLEELSASVGEQAKQNEDIFSSIKKAHHSLEDLVEFQKK
ncbi:MULTISPECIES: methyl-accepting chemotaxis protein [Bacillus]|uniref:Methyl-accepting transducer domain-containing protein n=2 Tax=Bacillaceae TaxID=186817 RepID=U5LDH4_9BACI|nr:MULTISPECIES: methyl-accepting chemotaxis protein [Bacillus]AGX05453.1 hypothetical protein N288_17850 [Bacillus infantis NRRL B-14911]EAR65216.1 methyl-accepting chemotaxis protein [Bacillus sp. NRRL B-14911]